VIIYRGIEQVPLFTVGHTDGMWSAAFDTVVDDETLVGALIAVLSLRTEDVLVTAGHHDPRVLEHSGLLCVQMLRRGQFPMWLDLCRVGSASDDIVPSPDDLPEERLMGRLCRQLHARCLISDENPDPDTWLLIDGTAPARPVRIDLDR
jgi:hypothetical protein